MHMNTNLYIATVHVWYPHQPLAHEDVEVGFPELPYVRHTDLGAGRKMENRPLDHIAYLAIEFIYNAPSTL